ncbi:TPA: hypothetical protein ACGOVI_001851 [Streptococcus suis]
MEGKAMRNVQITVNISKSEKEELTRMVGDYNTLSGFLARKVKNFLDKKYTLNLDLSVSYFGNEDTIRVPYLINKDDKKRLDLYSKKVGLARSVLTRLIIIDLITRENQNKQYVGGNDGQ